MSLSIAKPALQIQLSHLVIDLTDSLADITANIIHDSKHYLLPSDIFENVILEAINDLVDDFAINPDCGASR